MSPILYRIHTLNNFLLPIFDTKVVSVSIIYLNQTAYHILPEVAEEVIKYEKNINKK